MIYLTSDLHFNHNKEFIYKARGYDNVEDMNIDIVNKWNSIIAATDDVYILGDVCMGELQSSLSYLRQLKGNIKIILGNHDTDKKIEEYAKLPNVTIVGIGARLRVGKFSFYLTHFPMEVHREEKDTDKTYSLHGHTHQEFNTPTDILKGYFNVGLDANQMYPVSLDEVVGQIKELRANAKRNI